MKIYILTPVNAWTELVYIQYFTTLEKAQSVMKSQMQNELMYENPDTIDYQIGERGAYIDNGGYEDREKYRWNITEMEV